MFITLALALMPVTYRIFHNRKTNPLSSVSTMDASTFNKIQDCLDNFDFERVHKVMVALDWKWFMLDGERIPSIKDLRNNAERLLSIAVRDNDTISLGGFKASYFVTNETPMIRLSFIVEEQTRHL